MTSRFICGAWVYWYTSSLNHIIWFPVLYIIIHIHTRSCVLCIKIVFFFTHKTFVHNIFCTASFSFWSTWNSPLNNIISIRYTISDCSCTIRTRLRMYNAVVSKTRPVGHMWPVNPFDGARNSSKSA